MESRGLSFFVRTLGRNGTRILYGLIGIALVAAGVLGLMGIIDLESGR